MILVISAHQENISWISTMHGYGGYFTISLMIFDRKYRKDEAYDDMKECVWEFHKGLIINSSPKKARIC